MLLVFDTESSGLLKAELDPLDPAQPHMVQLGAQLFDAQWRKRAHLTVLIKPSGWEIEPGAEAVHGISTQTCHRYGVELAAALVPFRALVMTASRIVGHHVQFDRRVIGSAIHRAGGDGNWWARAAGKLCCTMETATPVLNLPGEFGAKFPSLEEAVTGLCPGREFPVKHDADSDIAATLAVYRALLDRGALQPPDAFSTRLT